MRNKFLFLSFLTPILLFSQKDNTLQIIEPTIDENIKVGYSECKYIDYNTYLINENFVVYEDCTKRKVIYPDLKTFRLPKHNNDGLFAIDKNGIYFKGEKIKIDTTGFKIIGIRNIYRNPDALWKTNDAVYKNTEKIIVSDVSTFESIQCKYGSYFKDKNFVYYFDKKIENSDGSSVKDSCSEFTYDKNNAYLNGKIITFENEKVIQVNRFFYKTSKYVLTRNSKIFTIQPNIDAQSLKGLSEYYSVDKNHTYYRDKILPIKQENLQNIKIWEQVNRAYISDGEKVYSKYNDLPNNFDAKSFGMLPHSDFCYDKTGVYDRKWLKNEKKVVYVKFPFEYKTPVSDKNTVITDNSRYIIYENQAYDAWRKKVHLNLNKNQISLLKQNKLKLDKTKNNEKVKIDEKFDYSLYKSGDKIYWDDKETIANAKTFSRVGKSGMTYKDDLNVYIYSRNRGLLTLDGIDNKTVASFNGFIKDKTYLFLDNQKIIKSKDINLLAVFNGYRMGCSRDTTPTSNFYLFRNFEGHWLVEISDNVVIRNLGKKLPNQSEWIPNLKDEFVNK